MTQLIEEFRDAYLYEEYEDDYEDYGGALVAFMDDSEPQDRSAFLAEWKGLQSKHQTEADMEAALDGLDWDAMMEEDDTPHLGIVAYSIEIIEAYLEEA